MNPIVHVLFSSTVAFLFLFLVTKIMGKKQIAQLSFLDYVIGISLGSIAAEMATDNTRPFYYFVIGIAVFTVLDLFLTIISRKALILKKIIKGKPLVLIEDGVINYQNLIKSKLDTNDLLSMCRANGYFDLKKVAFCVFETNGEFSILPTAEASPIIAEHFNILLPKVELSKDVIVDGKIVLKTLAQIGKSVEWLYDKIGIKERLEAKSIVLATYYKDTDEVVVQSK